MSLAEDFLARVHPDARAAVAGVPSLADVLESHWSRAASRHAGLAIDRGAFLEHLAEKVSSASDAVRALLDADAPSLALALACAKGDGQALQIFDEQYLQGALEPVLARLGAKGAEVDELLQTLRLKLLVAPGGGRAGIGDYSGRGALEGWLRVIAVREVIKARQRQQREVPLEDDHLMSIAFPAGEPEIFHVKAQWAGEFRRAFKDALKSLSPRDRTVLRYNVIDGLSIDEIGRLYNVHRASAARWLVKARESLLWKTREHLKERLEVSDEELDSILRAIESQLDASLASA